MSSEELNRLEILQRVLAKRLSQRKAAELLGLSERHARRLVHALKEDGAPGLVSKRRGKPSNHRLDETLKSRVLDIVREHYADFGPTLALEKLVELHDIHVSRETLRHWMTETNVWVPRKRRRIIHQPRHRRECLGELVQIDGSDHGGGNRVILCTHRQPPDTVPYNFVTGIDSGGETWIHLSPGYWHARMPF